MTTTYNTPDVIKNLVNLNYRSENDCIDFEPYGEFLSPEKTAFILHCWTGDKKYHGEEFRIFGCSADGSEIAIWLIHEDKSILEQPVVLLESEGQAYTISTNFSDFLWYLGNEAYFVTDSVLDYIHSNTTTPKRAVEKIIEEANKLYDFNKYIWSKVKY